MKKQLSVVTLAGLMFAGSVALAQGTGTSGPGPGGTAGTPGSGANIGSSPAGPQGVGPTRPTPMPLSEANTPGWNQMSSDQRSSHEQRMQSFKSYNDCNSYMSQMRARAGLGAGNAAAGNDPCSHLPRS